MSDSGGHKEFAVAALGRLGRAPTGDPPAIRLLAGGLSGSAVYRLDLAGEDVVLKVTLPGGDPRRLERARREALFYRELARRVSLPVPRLIDVDLDETEGVVLLLAASEPSPPPDRWTADDFAEVAHLLGRFHATFWGKTAELAMPAWIRAKPRVSSADCQKAARQWDALHERGEFRELLAPYRTTLRLCVLCIAILGPGFAPVPATLCHGDCHAGNLLREPGGEWIWADWQEVGLGPGVDDLSFLWQRAFTATETPPPYDAMVEAYGAGLETDVRRQPDRKQLDRALAWSELTSWIVAWPSYVDFLPVERVARVVDRIGLLAERLRIAGRQP